MGTREEHVGNWFGAGGQVSRFRDVIFRLGCLGATLTALLLMLTFLIYVANDALAPLSADAGWLVTFGMAVGVPAVALGVYYFRADTRAGEVAAVATGLPIAASLAAGGVAIVFMYVITPVEWLALVLSVLVAAAAIMAYDRVRSPGALERLAVLIVVPTLTSVGVPGPTPSVRELLLSLPVLPIAPVALLVAFTLPVALGAGGFLRAARESDRAGIAAAAGIVAVAGIGIVLGPLVGLEPWVWIVLATVVVVPVELYVEHVLHHGTGRAGLAFPVAIAAGIGLGTLVTATFGFDGPTSWLTWGFLTSPHSRTARDAGINPALVGSVMMMIIVAIASLPAGIGAAIYLEEYAPSHGLVGSLVSLLKINIANLAGVPSVVYGALGLALFIRLGGLGMGTVVVGGLTIALLILPIVIVAAQEAIQSVPDSLRTASYGMGATRWQTTRNVVLPRATPGILTGTILAFGRAIGETAPLLMIGAPAYMRSTPEGFFSKLPAMPRQIFAWSTEITTEFRYGVLAAGVLTLLAVMLMMNATAIVLRNRYQRES